MRKKKAEQPQDNRNTELYEALALIEKERGIPVDFMLAQKTIDREPDPKNSFNRSHANVEYGFNDHPCFKGFNEILGIIFDCEAQIGKMKQEAAEIKRERERKLGLYQDNYISSNLIFCDL